jgi:hypothetical protein
MAGWEGSRSGLSEQVEGQHPVLAEYRTPAIKPMANNSLITQLLRLVTTTAVITCVAYELYPPASPGLFLLEGGRREAARIFAYRLMFKPFRNSFMDRPRAAGRYTET